MNRNRDRYQPQLLILTPRWEVLFPRLLLGRVSSNIITWASPPSYEIYLSSRGEVFFAMVPQTNAKTHMASSSKTPHSAFQQWRRLAGGALIDSTRRTALDKTTWTAFPCFSAQFSRAFICTYINWGLLKGRCKPGVERCRCPPKFRLHGPVFNKQEQSCYGR